MHYFEILLFTNEKDLNSTTQSSILIDSTQQYSASRHTTDLGLMIRVARFNNKNYSVNL